MTFHSPPHLIARVTRWLCSRSQTDIKDAFNGLVSDTLDVAKSNVKEAMEAGMDEASGVLNDATAIVQNALGEEIQNTIMGYAENLDRPPLIDPPC